MSWSWALVATQGLELGSKNRLMPTHLIHDGACTGSGGVVDPGAACWVGTSLQWRVWRHGARGSAHEQLVSENAFADERRKRLTDFSFSGLKLYFIYPDITLWRGLLPF